MEFHETFLKQPLDSMSLEYMQSFIKIGGVVSEKKSYKKHTDYEIYY